MQIFSFCCSAEQERLTLADFATCSGAEELLFVDETQCIGCMACASVAPDTFSMVRAPLCCLRVSKLCLMAFDCRSQSTGERA